MVRSLPTFMQTSGTELVTGIAKMVIGYAMHMSLVLLVSDQYESRIRCIMLVQVALPAARLPYFQSSMLINDECHSADSCG